MAVFFFWFQLVNTDHKLWKLCAWKTEETNLSLRIRNHIFSSFETLIDSDREFATLCTIAMRMEEISGHTLGIQSPSIPCSAFHNAIWRFSDIFSSYFCCTTQIMFSLSWDHLNLFQTSNSLQQSIFQLKDVINSSRVSSERYQMQFWYIASWPISGLEEALLQVL